MAKKAPGVPNRHIYSRISFLYQAAVYLAETGRKDQGSFSQKTLPAQDDATADIKMEYEDETKNGTSTTQEGKPNTAIQNMSRRMLTDLRAATLKSQIRISPEIKRSICKYCDTLLVDGQTSSSIVENKSKGGKKPWADVLVIQCHTCGREKRFPVSAPKQKRRPLRVSTISEDIAQKAVP